VPPVMPHIMPRVSPRVIPCGSRGYADESDVDPMKDGHSWGNVIGS